MDRVAYPAMSHGTNLSPLGRLAEWLHNSSLHDAFVNSEWFVPAVQTIHILGIAVVVTTLAMLNVRLLKGPGAKPPLRDIARTYLPWTWAALLILLLSGSLLIVTEPDRELLSSPFFIKMLLVIGLTALTCLVQLTVRRDDVFWYASPFRRAAASIIGVTNLLLCASIVAAGRLIAYIVHG